MEFNIIVTHEPGRDNYYWALNQIRDIVGHEVRVVYSKQSLIFLKARDPHEVARRIRSALRGSSTPIFRVIPIDAVVDPLITQVKSEVLKLASKIPKNETYRITIQGHLYGFDEHGRFTRLHTMDSIKILASDIDRKVNLTNPHWILFIKVVMIRNREVAAISLLQKFEFENVQRG